jgi:hypothetical protein
MGQTLAHVFALLTLEQKLVYWQSNPDELDKQIKRWKTKQQRLNKCR